MNLSTNIAGIPLEHPIMNGAGSCKLLEGPEGVETLARSATAAVVVGSITMAARPGNSGNVFWSGEHYSLNSLGLPNPGAEYYRNQLPRMAELAHRAGKPLWVSVAGFSPSEYAELAVIAQDGTADIIELNLGCPNVWQDDRQKPIASFVPDLVNEILNAVAQRVHTDTVVSVKISPFSNPFALEALARMLDGSKAIRAITAVNTLPNALALDEAGEPRISGKGGFAGMSGPALKPYGLAHVKQLHSLLGGRFQIIGVGGIESGQDVLDYLRVGASAVQVVSRYLEEREKVFTRILSEYVELVEANS